MEQLRWKWVWWSGGALLVAGVLWLSLLPAGSVPAINAWDKLEHALGYFVLTLWFAGLARWDQLVTAAAGTFALGGVCEVLQAALAAGRVAEVGDLVANGVGVLVAFAAARAGLGRWMYAVERLLGGNSKRAQ